MGHFFCFYRLFPSHRHQKKELGFQLFEHDLEGSEFTIKKTEARNERQIGYSGVWVVNN